MRLSVPLKWPRIIPDIHYYDCNPLIDYSIIKNALHCT